MSRRLNVTAVPCGHARPGRWDQGFLLRCYLSVFMATFCSPVVACTFRLGARDLALSTSLLAHLSAAATDTRAACTPHRRLHTSYSTPCYS